MYTYSLRRNFFKNIVCKERNLLQYKHFAMMKLSLLRYLHSIIKKEGGFFRFGFELKCNLDKMKFLYFKKKLSEAYSMKFTQEKTAFDNIASFFYAFLFFIIFCVQYTEE